MPPARIALYAASAGLVLLTVWALVVRPPPLAWAVVALVTYTTIVFGGVLVLRWRVFVDAIVQGPRNARGVALTFDDGPHPRWTPQVLEMLAKRGASATFFCVGRKVDENPEVVRAILEQGHAVGLHSYGHDRLFALRNERRVREDLERGIAVLERVTGQRPVLFRPPIGHTNPTVARVVHALGLMVVGWTVGGRDGVGSARPDDVVARVRRELRDGVIVLLHDAPERGDREPAVVRALPVILDAITAAGLEVVPLAHWLDHAHDGAGRTT
jgi:peptidoglycan/xylan/chitin deacetylase (PgdA/CDA1 family)